MDKAQETKWQKRLGRNSGPQSADAEESSVATVVLVRGEDMEGQPQWAYALIPADSFLAFRMAEAEGNYNLAEFGTVIHHGPGDMPPEDIQQQMAEEYGCNPKFEEELEAMLIEALEQLPDLDKLV